MTQWDDDDEGEEPYESNDEEDDLTMPCPHCGEAIFDEAVRCPECGAYLSKEHAHPARKPWWLVLGVMVCLYAVYRWLLKG